MTTDSPHPDFVDEDEFDFLVFCRFFIFDFVKVWKDEGMSLVVEDVKCSRSFSVF